MGSSVVECPAGLVVTVREYEVRDEDLLANPRNVRRGLAVSSLLSAITVSVDDPGLYGAHVKGERLDWKNVLQGECQYVLKANRIATWGEEYEYRCPCPNCRQTASNWIDLTTLAKKELPEASVEHVLKGTDLSCLLPSCGKKAYFRLLRGKDDKGLRKIQKQNKDGLSSGYLRFRTTKIEGVNPPDLMSFIEGMSSRDSSFLRAEFDRQDCGVEHEAELECEHCDHSWRDDVRFNADFLFPRFRAKTTRTGS